MKTTPLLVALMVLLFAPAVSSADICTIQIAACIDHESQLIIKGNTAQWHEIGGTPPGEHSDCGEDNATVINGVDWFPSWADVPCAGCYSDVFQGVNPPLPASAMNVSLNSTGRGTVEVIQQPSAGNDYTLVIRFFDSDPGAAPYTASFEFECNLTVPALNPWGLAALLLLLAASAVWMVRRRRRAV